MGEIKVSKFGGSSVKDADAMRACTEIVKNDSCIKVIILSATYNTTNNLEKVAKLASLRKIDEAKKVLEEIKEKHLNIASDLNADEATIEELRQIIWEGESLISGISLLKECSKRAMDRLYSLGERMSTRLFLGVLNKTFKDIECERQAILLDATKIIKTNSDFCKALPKIDMIQKKVTEHLLPLLQNSNNIILTQGFIGSNGQGAITTLGREGSDFSAALIAEAINASLLQIWTDVPGVATTDPRLVSSAKTLKNLSYDEASTMAQLGARVLFPKTLHPVKRKNIPVFVGSSKQPSKGGTWIDDLKKDLPFFRALSVMDKQNLVTISSNHSMTTTNFFKSVLDILNTNKVSYNFLHFEGSNVTFLLQDKNELADDIIHSISNFAQVKLEDSFALVSVIGNKMDQASKNISKVLGSLADRKIRMIQLGGCSRRLSFLVPSVDYQEIVQDLHDQLIE